MPTVPRLTTKFVIFTEMYLKKYFKEKEVVELQNSPRRIISVQKDTGKCE